MTLDADSSGEGRITTQVLEITGGSDLSERFDVRSAHDTPQPGMIVSIPVKEGQPIEKGDVLLILESMKMQNELKAPRAGTVGRIRVKTGESVEQRQTLLSVL